MRSTLSALALVSVVLLGAGCKKTSPIVGKWNGQAGMLNVDLDFKSDGTFTAGTKVGNLNIASKGDYKLDGENLTITTKDIDAPGAPPALIAQAKASPQLGKSEAATFKLTSDDEASLSGFGGTSGGQAISLKRVKS